MRFSSSRLLSAIGIAGMIFSTGTMMVSRRIESDKSKMYATLNEKLTVYHEAYRNRMAKLYGKNRANALRDSLNNVLMGDIPMDKSQVDETGMGKTMCLDLYSGRYFRSDIHAIKHAVDELNKRGPRITLNDFYHALKRPSVWGGNYVGWNNLIDIYYSSHCMTDGTKVFVLDYRPEILKGTG